MLYMNIYADAAVDSAPVHRVEGSTKVLVTLKANLSVLPRSDLKQTIKKAWDGKSYYHIDGVIEATFGSAETTYVLFCQGKRYDTVKAEYAY